MKALPSCYFGLMREKIAKIVKLVKLQHALFALPFTLSAMIMAAGGLPDWKVIGLIVVAFMSARSFGMALNRLIDKDIDAKNPRTAHRLMASGGLNSRTLYPFLIFFAFLLGLCAYLLNDLCLKLLPLCYAVLILYPFTKRFTLLAHTVLGLVLSLAPIGAWAAVTNQLDWAPLYLGLSILFWVNGFDIIYAIQDEDFDRDNKLHSVPARLGKAGALKVAFCLHLVVPVFWFMVGQTMGYSEAYFSCIGLLTILLVGEHILVHRGYQKNLGLAFFKLNSTISVIYLIGIVAEVFF